MSPWEWLTTTTSVESMLSTLGLGALAVLFATNRIITKGQHESRVADLKEHHARELAAADKRLEATDESRREWRAAAGSERERADTATATANELGSELGGLAVRLLSSIDETVNETVQGEGTP